jgi:hypothetical protein
MKKQRNEPSKTFVVDPNDDLNQALEALSHEDRLKILRASSRPQKDSPSNSTKKPPKS